VLPRGRRESRATSRPEGAAADLLGAGRADSVRRANHQGSPSRHSEGYLSCDVVHSRNPHVPGSNLDTGAPGALGYHHPEFPLSPLSEGLADHSNLHLCHEDINAPRDWQSPSTCHERTEQPGRIRRREVRTAGLRVCRSGNPANSLSWLALVGYFDKYGRGFQESNRSRRSCHEDVVG
jgi:hypothetical protein